jgi:hypothetical protein
MMKIEHKHHQLVIVLVLFVSKKRKPRNHIYKMTTKKRKRSELAGPYRTFTILTRYKDHDPIPLSFETFFVLEKVLKEKGKKFLEFYHKEEKEDKKDKIIIRLEKSKREVEESKIVDEIYDICNDKTSKRSVHLSATGGHLELDECAGLKVNWSILVNPSPFVIEITNITNEPL